MDQDAAETIPLKARDDYEPIDRIGRGAFGDVFLCRHRVRGDRVCVKEVDLQLLSPVERRGCLEEVAVLRRLPRHPHIISLLDAFRDQASPNLLLLVLEFADAGDLALFLHDAQDAGSDGRSVAHCHQQFRHHALHLFAQVAKGVAFLHARNVLHRDLKPHNVLLFRSTEQRTAGRELGSSVRAVVGDFGSSKTLSSSAALAQTVVGSPLYMSPELLESEPHGPPTDVWSLGCLLYELLSGLPPFRGPSYPAVVRKITRGEYAPLSLAQAGDEQVRELVARMLQHDPSKRPTAEELLQSPVLTPYAPVEAEDSADPSGTALVGAIEGDAARTTKPHRPTVVSEGLDPSQVAGTAVGEANTANTAAAMPPPAPVERPEPSKPVALSSSMLSGVAASSCSGATSNVDDAAALKPWSGPHTAERHAPIGRQQLSLGAPHALRQRQRHPTRIRTPEAQPLPPPPVSSRAPALRPSFLPKTKTRPSPTAPAASKAMKARQKLTAGACGVLSVDTTTRELLVVGVGVASKRPPAPTTSRANPPGPTDEPRASPSSR